MLIFEKAHPLVVRIVMLTLKQRPAHCWLVILSLKKATSPFGWILTLNWKKTANLLVGDVDLEEGQLLNTE